MTSPDTLGTGVTFAGAAESSTQLTGPLVATYSGHAAFVPIENSIEGAALWAMTTAPDDKRPQPLRGPIPSAKPTRPPSE